MSSTEDAHYDSTTQEPYAEESHAPSPVIPTSTSASASDAKDTSSPTTQQTQTPKRRSWVDKLLRRNKNSTKAPAPSSSPSSSTPNTNSDITSSDPPQQTEQPKHHHKTDFHEYDDFQAMNAMPLKAGNPYLGGEVGANVRA